MTVLPFSQDFSGEPEDSGGSPHARSTDPETSKMAGRERLGWEAIEKIILRCYANELLTRGEGLADHEVMDRCGWDMSQEGRRRRCSDLRYPKKNKEGEIIRPPLTQLVHKDGKKVSRISKHSGHGRGVYTLNEAGIQAFFDLPN